MPAAGLRGPGRYSAGTLAYSVFQQGAGLINAVAAANSSATGCANLGLDISADLAGTEHFGGPANEDANGHYYIMNMQGPSWGGSRPQRRLLLVDRVRRQPRLYLERGLYLEPDLLPRDQAYTWSSSYLWSKGYTWSESYLWSKSASWWGSNSSPSGSASPASIESWVPNQ